MFCMVKKEKIHPAYLSERNSNSEKQFILKEFDLKERKMALYCCKNIISKEE